jgi:hypothetical protein
MTWRNILIKTGHDRGSFHVVINIKLAELYLLLFLFTCLGYYIFNLFNLFGSIVQLLLLGVAMKMLFVHSVICMLHIFIHVVLYVYDNFQIFGSMECENKLQLQYSYLQVCHKLL